MKTLFIAIAIIFFSGSNAQSAQTKSRVIRKPPASGGVQVPRVIYPKKTDLDFEGLKLEGELRNPGEFYFQYKPEEKFDSLVKARKNFHREMLRDVVMSK